MKKEKENVDDFYGPQLGPYGKPLEEEIKEQEEDNAMMNKIIDKQPFPKS